MNKLLLIDGSNLIFRAYFASMKQNIKTLDDRPAGAIKTLIGMINKIVEQERPTHMFIALDTKAPTFRHENYEDYKAGRSATPEDLKTQFPMAQELYDAMGICHYGVDGYEADDLIATYAKQAVDKGFKVKVLSGDKDLLQLVDENVEVITPKAGRSEEVNYTREVFEEKFTFPPERFIEYKAIVGDSSDNIIGVPKWGDKKTKTLINNYDTWEAMVEAANNGEIKGVAGASLAESGDVIKNNIELVTLIEDAPLEIEVEDLKQDSLASEAFINYLNELGFQKYANDFSKRLGEEVVIEVPNVEYKVIDSFDPSVHTSKETYVYTQALGDNYFTSPGLGFGIASKAGTFYIPVDKIDDNFKAWLKTDAKKVVYDHKQMCGVVGFYIEGVIFDSMIAASLIDVTLNKAQIDYIMAKFGSRLIRSFESIYKVKSNPQMPEFDDLALDICSKAKAIRDTFGVIANEIEMKNLMTVMYDIELPLVESLVQMEANGITIDMDNVESLKKKYSGILDSINEQIKEYTTINVSSPMQLSDYFFNTRELPTDGIKKTARGYSTDVTNLNKLLDNIDSDSDDAKLIKLILEHRIYSKLLNTYVLGLVKNVNDEHKVKPIYNQLLSETGRLSTREPSIQNIPIRSEEGQVIRSLFGASEAYKIVAIDYSQVELRMMAHISQDASLIDAFNHGADIHASTAETIFGTSEGGNRSKAKAINFGIIYGMSRYGLAKQVGISNAEAAEFIDKYFENYPAIKDYIDNTIEACQETGSVSTINGRLREIPDINSSNYMMREHAKNAAINTPVQGSAADLIKIAMIKVNEHIKSTKTKMIMQIHDELVFEISEDELESEIAKICEIMQEASKLRVPLKVDYGVGDNWLEAK